MKIYFACSIRGEQGGKEEKELIVNTLKELGHEVLSEIFTTLDKDNNHSSKGTMTPAEVYKWDMNWVRESDVIVADVSRISTGLGYEIGWKLSSGGKVVALCREDKYDDLSNMIKGCTEPNFSLKLWKGMEHPEQLKEILLQEIT